MHADGNNLRPILVPTGYIGKSRKKEEIVSLVVAWGEAVTRVVDAVCYAHSLHYVLPREEER